MWSCFPCSRAVMLAGTLRMLVNVHWSVFMVTINTWWRNVEVPYQYHFENTLSACSRFAILFHSLRSLSNVNRFSFNPTHLNCIGNFNLAGSGSYSLIFIILLTHVASSHFPSKENMLKVIWTYNHTQKEDYTSRVFLNIRNVVYTYPSSLLKPARFLT